MSSSPSPHCCILFTTDSRYLFPTLVSAMQARAHASARKADVIIYCVDLQPSVREVFEPLCTAENILLADLPSSTIEGQTAMLARLFLDRFVPHRYTQILYLDGDVQIHESLDPLLSAEVPAGHFLAANDPTTFWISGRSGAARELARHFSTLGLTEKQALGYFNSGVLRIDREGWDAIGMKAWEFFQFSGTSRRFPDQDALNAAGLDRRLPLSLAWNYPVFLHNARVTAAIQPRITHFMSSPKPWHGSFSPWTRQACLPYKEALTKYPALEPFHYPMSLSQRLTYKLQQQGKRCLEFVTWGLGPRRQRVLQYEAACATAALSV